MNSESVKVEANLRGVVDRSRNQYMKIVHALLELIDNSVDAGATAISVREQDGDLVIEDNGRGFDDIASALVIGISNKTDAIGRYGVGLKDACIRYSNQTRIVSRGVSVSVPWMAIAEGRSDGTVLKERCDSDGRTYVILEDFRERYNHNEGLKTNEVQRVYSQILKDGAVSISVNGAKLSPLREPDYTQTIDERFCLDGKNVRLRGGIFKTDDPARNDWYGYNAYYMGRLIGIGHITNIGTGDAACGNFCFILDLDDSAGKWTLATNKDHVEELDDLIRHCYHTYTAPMLEQAAKETEDLKLKSIEEEITAAINGESLGNITRGKPANKKTGTVKPSNKGPKKKRTETDDSPGKYISSSLGRRAKQPLMRFKFEPLAGNSLGHFEVREKFTLMTANLNNPFIRDNRANRELIVPMMKLVHSVFIQAKRMDVAETTVVNEILEIAGNQIA
jgi:hypothetical protein